MKTINDSNNNNNNNNNNNKCLYIYQYMICMTVPLITCPHLHVVITCVMFT